jgi:hypothetical protein
MADNITVTVNTYCKLCDSMSETYYDMEELEFIKQCESNPDEYYIHDGEFIRNTEQICPSCSKIDWSEVRIGTGDVIEPWRES